MTDLDETVAELRRLEELAIASFAKDPTDVYAFTEAEIAFRYALCQALPALLAERDVLKARLEAAEAVIVVAFPPLTETSRCGACGLDMDEHYQGGAASNCDSDIDPGIGALLDAWRALVK